MWIKLIRFMARILPDGLAYSLIRSIAAIPVTPPQKKSDRAILLQARRLSFGRKNGRVGWVWGEGPLVVLVHGWSGSGAQLAALAQSLVEQGFSAALFDVTAHGESKGLRVTFNDFMTDMTDWTLALDRPVFAYVGHSAGGLAMMAARELKGIRALRYVCLNAPLFPYVPVNDIRRIVAPSQAVLERFKIYYAGHFGLPWEELERGRAYRCPESARLFAVYDENDDRVHHADAERLRALWPSVKVMKTRGLGHQKVMWDRQVMEEVARFLLAS